jgi:hypothetical protein
MSKLRSLLLVIATILALVGAFAGPSFAAFPGPAKLVAFRYRGAIWTVNPNVRGAQAHRLITGDAPRWSPNGQKIAFERSSNIYVMNSNGTGVHQATFNGASHQPAWSPDGKKLVFVVVQHPHGDLFTMPAGGGAMTRLTNDAATSCGNDRPTWSPAGGIILFRNTPSVAGGCGLPRIRTVNVSSHAQRTVVDGAFLWGPPDISRNGSSVIAVRHSNCAAQPVPCTDDLLKMNLNGGNQQVLARSPEGPELPFPVNDVAASPAGGFPVYVVNSQQVSPEREPCGLSRNNEFTLFFSSRTSCPSLPDWQP